MAKFVIAGSCDCPYLAKLELLAYQLSINLPQFDVHKIVLPPEQWPEWLAETCKSNEWSHDRSPIVWRELVERGGKGHLLGGFNEFCEYAQCYYGVTSSLMTDLVLKVRDENVMTCEETLKEKAEFAKRSKPIHVCIVNAISPVAYHLIPQLAAGDVFGYGVEVSIRLLDNQSNQEQLQGVAMETQDLAFPLLRNIQVYTNARDAMSNASAVIFLEDDDSPEADESRDEFLRNNAERFQNYARSLDDAALPDVKVVVAGSGPVNFGAYLLIDGVTKIKKENIAASSRLQDRRARAILSRRLKVNSDDIKNVLVLGNCSNNSPEKSSQVAMTMGSVHNYDGAIWGPSWFSRSLVDMVHDSDWLGTDLVAAHRDHDTDLTKSLKHSAAMSEAAALASLLRDWVRGSPENEVTSLGILSSGSYDVTDCVFSLPVRFVGGCYEVVADMTFNDMTRSEMKRIEAYLKKDLQIIFPSRFEDPSKPAFGEDSTILSPIGSKTELSMKTISGLTVIPEDAETEEVVMGTSGMQPDQNGLSEGEVQQADIEKVESDQKQIDEENAYIEADGDQIEEPPTDSSL